MPLLPFTMPCVMGTLVQRVKRFSIEFLLNGETCWAHTNNSGSMLGLIKKGAPILCSIAPGKERKLPYTLEMINLAVKGQPDLWVGVNTLTPNRLLRQAFYAGKLPWAAGYTDFRAEATRGESRLDALLTAPDLPPLWVECKNVTMVEDGIAAFPDAVTTRGQKHVREMMSIVASGERAAFFYCIQRGDGNCFAPADYVDPDYAALFYESHAAGVEAHPHFAPATPQGIDLGAELPLAPWRINT